MATTTATPEPRAFLDTIEGEIALCRSLIYHRPYGLDKHWAMIAIVTALRDSGGPDVEADDVWKKLETMYVSEEIEGVVPSPESPPITEFLEVPFAPIAANSKSLDPSPPTPLSGDESNIPHILKAIMERGLEREADRIKQGGSPQVDEEGFAAEESNVTPRKRARRDDGGNGSARKEDGDEESDLSDLPSEDEEDEEDEEAESGVEETGDEEEEEGESEGEGVEEKKKPSSGKGKKGQATKGGSIVELADTHENMQEG
ncbi:hypothetical protein MNV49_000483 [Pseudohyphozyma bogoriensis]|nr:hypothetical protein MNV49_000483 [Pseudohyphozyma bogoriensis]